MLKIFMNEPFATGHELAQALLKDSLASVQKSLMNGEICFEQEGMTILKAEKWGLSQWRR